MRRPDPDSCHIARNVRGKRLSTRQKILRMGEFCPFNFSLEIGSMGLKHGFHRTDGEAMSRTGAA